jgi:hypothetical protein
LKLNSIGDLKMASGDLVIKCDTRRIAGLSERIKAASNNALAAYGSELISAMQSEIITEKWSVGFSSMRWADGKEVAGPTRNIYDSGTLYDSFYIDFRETKYGGSLEIGNTSGYVSAVRFGYTTARSGYSPAKGLFEPRWMPGRDFVASARAGLPLGEFVKSRGVTGSGRLPVFGASGPGVSSTPVRSPSSYK